MTLEQEHPLLWQTRTTHTTDWATCGCGQFAMWAPQREHMKAAHALHLEQVRQAATHSQAEQRKPTFVVPSFATLHTLKWLHDGGRLFGLCSACDWKIDSRPKVIIEQAFEAHLQHITREKTY